MGRAAAEMGEEMMETEEEKGFAQFTWERRRSGGGRTAEADGKHAG